MWSAVVLAAGCLLAVTSGSKIILSANPDVLTTNLTQSITMRCSLNDTDVLPTPTAGGVVGKRDVTQTTENMQTLTSLVITRNNGDHVATLIQGQQPKALADLANMQVKGNLSGSGAPGEQGYLELTWLYPTTAQTGEYVCEVNTISSLGHNVIFSTTVEIGESVPTIGELIGMVQTLEKSKDQMQNQLNGLQQNLTDLMLQTTPVPPTAVVSSSSLHVENGRVECGDSDNWKRDPSSDYGWATVEYHKFSRPYASKPIVQIGVNSIDHNAGVSTRYDVTLTSVDQNGFYVKCKTWEGPDGRSHVYHIWVDFISIA